jgi:hypothetical protein
MSYLRSASYECFLECFTLHYPVWDPILQIHSGIACMCPLKHRQTLFVHHGLHCTDDKLVLPLYNPILLQVVGHCLLPLDPRLLAEINELCRGVLTPVICLQYLDLPSCHVLHLSFESSKVTEDFVLGLREVDPGLSGEVINEGHIVGRTLH